MESLIVALVVIISPWMGVSFSVVGISLVAVSTVMYHQRTGDKRIFGRSWFPRSILTPTEHLMNRTGIVMTLAASFLMVAVTFIH